MNASGGNDANNGSSWLYAKQSISNATGTVNTNGTIYIATGTYNESNIGIHTNMTIIGENQKNTIINGQQSVYSIFITGYGVNLTIINLTLTNSSCAIDNGGTLTIDNSTFTNNNAADGGAILNGGNGALTVDNSTFTGNSALGGGGGAICNEGGGTLTETNDTFAGNSAPYGLGGAIYNYDGALTVDNSTFTGNSATDGGAICNINYGGLTVDNSTFTGNNVTYDGGAIYNEGGSTLTEANDTFTNNIANLGGAIFDEGILTFDNSTFTGNSAMDGGAIFNGGALTVDNSTFIGNTANVGGAIYDSADTASVHFNRIIGNTANVGGAIFNDGGTIDAEYNWWGSNINPEIIPNLIVNDKGSMNINTWIVLTITANPTTVDYDGASTVTADLLYDSGILNDPTNPSLYYHDPSNGHVPDGITVDFLGDALGNVNPLVSTFINGSANTTFTGLQPGVSEISTTVDNQTITTNININTIPTAITVTPVSGYNGDNVDLTATLTDTHSNIPVQDANVQFSINNHYRFTNTNTQIQHYHTL